MTVNEMKQEIERHCDSRHSCRGDSLIHECPLYDGSGCTLSHGDEDVRSAYYILFGDPVDEKEEIPTEVEHDVINRPNHYCRDGAMECIDEMVLVFGKEVVKHFCLCNIWKYRYRSAAKNGEEDIKKSDRYVQMYERLCSDE